MQTKLIPVALVLACSAVFVGKPEALSEDEPGFDRAQTLVVNLNKKVVGSAGYYLVEGLRFVDTMDHDLLKSLRQVQEVEKTYAKLRGKPDNRYFELTEVKIEKAISSNTALRDDIRDAYSEMKAQIKDVLVMDEASKKGGH